MGYALNNKLEVSVLFNENEYPLGAKNVLNFLHMGTSTSQRLPTVHMSITDTDNLISSLPDGLPIKVVIKSGSDNHSDAYTFRKFNSKRYPSSGCYIYEIDGYWDAAQYWSGTECVGQRGTSSDILSSIASTCGLKYDGPATNDSQLWMQQNDTFGSFAKRIADHGYINDQSCMVVAVDFGGQLLYRDMNNIVIDPVPVVANLRSKEALTAIDINIIANSGFNNQAFGYSSAIIVQSMVPPQKVTPAPTPSPDHTAVNNAMTGINTASSALVTANNTLKTTSDGLDAALSGQSLSTSKAILTSMLGQVNTTLSGTTAYQTAVGTANSLGPTLGKKAQTMVGDNYTTLQAGVTAMAGLPAQSSAAQALVTAATDTPSLNAAITATKAVGTSTLSGVSNINPSVLTTVVNGGLSSSIASTITSAISADAKSLTTPLTSDVLAAAKSANDLASSGISNATTAATVAAASGVASAGSGSSTSAISAASAAIANALTSSLNSAASSAATAIQNAVTTAASKAVNAPTYGEGSVGATSQPVNSIQFTADVRAPLVNTTVKEEVKRGAYIYSGIDVGNTHPSYDQAYYQNLRYRNLFSMKLELLMDVPTYLGLFSRINLAAHEINLKPSDAYSGVYIIVGRAIYIQGTTYSEKLQVVRHGTNDTYINS